MTCFDKEKIADWSLICIMTSKLGHYSIRK